MNSPQSQKLMVLEVVMAYTPIAATKSAAAAFAPDVNAGGIELRVMSFNVRWDGLDKGKNAWAHRRPVAIETIRMVAPDVVGLQEPSRAQTRDLAEGQEPEPALLLRLD